MRDRRTHILGRSAHPPLPIRTRRRRNHRRNRSPWQSQCRPFLATAAHRTTAVHIRQWRCRNRTTTTATLLCPPLSTSTGSFRYFFRAPSPLLSGPRVSLVGFRFCACFLELGFGVLLRAQGGRLLGGEGGLYGSFVLSFFFWREGYMH